MDERKIQAHVRSFARDRDWEQFHTPKNLATAMMVEAAEVNEIFQWLTPEQSGKQQLDEATLEHVGEELADVMIYCLRMADLLEIDIDHAIWDKLKKNAVKYPAEKFRGDARKYNQPKGKDPG